MHNMNTNISIDGVKLTPFTVNEIRDYIVSLLNSNRKSCQITYLNAYVYCLARRNKELNAIISESEVVLADGISIVWAALFLCRINISRCIMTKLFDDFLISTDLPKCKGILIGATDPEIKTAREKINRISKKVDIVGAYSGYHDNLYYSEVLKEHDHIDLILIGMSTPKSEFLCKMAREICNNSTIWHIGGGTIQCYAGTKRRAPEWTSRLGIEWMQRFIYEKHTRKRYLIYNMVFVYLILTGFFKSLFSRPHTGYN
jgi:N-acetylglucosaminyldiphosphoundecaprenol N-acetyl-beta-D-mannosaminyltransferase